RQPRPDRGRGRRVRHERPRQRQHDGGDGRRGGPGTGAQVRLRGGRMSRISRHTYASLYGPTTGDRVRLADTNLVLRIDHDYAVYGEEAAFGGGKSIRDGMAQSATALSRDGVPDTVITSAIVLDPVLGVVKGDIGIKDGRIVAIGKAGNPDVMGGVTPELVIGASTEI